MRRSTRLIFIVALLTALGRAAFLLHEGTFGEVEPEDRPLETKFEGYVSSDACQSCHPREYASWHASYHRTMTQLATPQTVLGDFDNVELEHDGRRYRLFRRGVEFWVEWDPPPGQATAGNEPPRIQRQVVLTTGSHHDQMYWHTTPGRGRDLRQLPFDYSLRLGRWIPAMSAFMRPPDTAAGYPQGHWNRVCSECHSVNPDLRATNWSPAFDSAHMDTRVAEFGISCEACHGPGGEHAELNRNPLRRYSHYSTSSRDTSIVQPGHLDSRRASAVCGQCHGIWIEGADPHGYQPGMDFEGRRVYFQMRYADPDYVATDEADRRRHRAILSALRAAPGFTESIYWDDGIVRVSGREYSGLLESPCYERGEMTCMSCHAMHQADDDPRPVAEWASDQLGVGMETNRACTDCHPGFEREALTAHTHHAADSSGSLCYNCHMPFSVYGIQKAHRSHVISNPSVDESLETGRPNACNQCHLDRTLAWSAERLRAWYGIPEPPLRREQSSVAAGVLWALSGDAGQRALIAWAMGWDAAREASGGDTEPDWMIPYLGQLLDDPYDSVRFVAWIALQKRSAFSALDYDFMGPPAHRRQALRAARGDGVFLHVPIDGSDGSAVLLDERGNLRAPPFERLLRRRDDSAVVLQE